VTATTIPSLGPASVLGRREWVNRAGTPALAVLSVVLWLFGLHPVTPGQLDSLGLIDQLSPVLLAAYPILVAAVVIELATQRPRQRLVAVYTALGVLFVYGLQPASEQIARMSVAWLHVGFARYIADHGQTLGGYDGRFSWPGFFSLAAFVSRASGQADLTPLLQWAPVVLAGLATLGTRALAVAALGADRRAWLATWVFLLTEWTEQDYFSPQATTYVVMLGALALTVQYLVRPGPGMLARTRPRGRPVPLNTSRDRLVAEAAILLIALALAPSHQLTSFLFAGLLLVMLLTGWLWTAWLPWAVLIPAVAWFSLGARDFWQGQLKLVIGDVGQIGSSVDQGLSQRFVGDAGRTFILDVRVGLTLVVALLAAGGWWWLRRHGFRSWALPPLAIAPFGLITLQSYGGEVFLRCFLFALPFAAILASLPLHDLLATTKHGRGMRAAALSLAVVVLTVLGLATVTARGGNDAYTSFSRADLAAVQFAYQHAAPGQTIGGLTGDLPIGYARIGEVLPVSFEDTCHELTSMDNCILDRPSTFLVVTPSQDNAGQIYYGYPAGWTTGVVRQLIASGKYHLVYTQDDSLVLAEADAGVSGKAP
jgi:hypothetical protein